MGGGIRVGERFAGYQIERLLGRGGMAVVFLAEDLQLGRKVTLKILAPELAADPAFRDRFVGESRIAAALEHPNIVPIYEARESEGELFIAMRFVRGADLAVLIKEGPLDPARAVSIVRQVANALDAAHAEGLVHRDVKPGNILVSTTSAGEHAYLSDFGISKRISPERNPTMSGPLVGTLNYVAPEQIQGHAADARTDVYSLGCVLYECLTGSAPFHKEADVAILWAHLHEPPPRVTAARADLVPAIDTVVARAMAKDPSLRYPSCGELASDVERTLSEPVAAEPASRQAGRSQRRRTRRRWLAAAAIVVIAGVGAALALFPRGPDLPASAGTLWRIDPSSVQAVRTETWIPENARGMAAGEGAHWFTTDDSLFIVRAGESPEQIELGISPNDIGLGSGTVWLAGNPPDGGPGRVVRVSPSTLTTSERELPGTGWRVGVGAGGIWALGDRPPTLSRIDLVEERLDRPIPLDRRAEDLGLSGSTVWLVHDNGDLSWVDSDTEEVGERPIETGGPADRVYAGAGKVWVIDSAGGRVVPVDQATRQPGEAIDLGFEVKAGASGSDALWVAGHDTVVRLDSETLERTPVPVEEGVIALAADHSLGPGEKTIYVLVGEEGQ